MANNPVQWSALSSVVHAVTGVATTGMRNQAAAAVVLGAEVDNSSGYQYGVFFLTVTHADTPHAGDYLGAWLVKAVDGTNYETPMTTTNVYARPVDLVFPVLLLATKQIVTVGPVLLPPGKFKVAIQMGANHGTANANDTDSLLELYMVNDNLVTV
jgi:hypothetical protein